MQVEFENTAIAFESKSTSELKRAYWLFKLISAKWMVNTGKFLTKLGFALHLPIKGIIKATLFKQFVGGESIEDCEPTIQHLWKYHIGTILDYSVEGKEDEESFDASLYEILRTFDKASGDERIPFCVFKVTGLARQELLEKVSKTIPLTDEETEEWTRVKNRVEIICQKAFNIKKPVFIDAEETWIQPAIDLLAWEMMQKYNQQHIIVYNTIQLYRHDRLEYLKNLHHQAQLQGVKIGVKLVRGAYMEKERDRAATLQYADPIQPNKSATDHDFDCALEYCIENLNDIAFCAGSHNEASAQLLVNLMRSRNISPNHPHVWFAQLLGMSDHISFNLAKAGFNVAKYVPYGPVKEVVPYLIRRAEENTSVKGQTGRELSLITRELKRRNQG
ncbi:MAG: proline dehydrogenase family protein [Flavobacteriales bacterium]|nr:proline dehydrogenase family protein [Flavobacteriales bacterium]